MKDILISVGLFLAALLIAVGPWMEALETWEQVFNPENIGPLLGIVGGVVWAWLTKTPYKSKGEKK